MIMGELSYKLVTNDGELQGAFEVRRRVFVEEQGVPENEEYDDCDSEALHIVAKEGDRVIGTARVQFLADNHAKIERMAVLIPFRRKGIGTEIMNLLDEELKNRQVKQAVLHAQCTVAGFYESCGFEKYGPTFLEVGIEHIKMQKQIE
jgi:predicted GNAT family N-acyltransferase